MTAVWPIQFAQSLPTVPVPLLPEDPDAALDLQRAFTDTYDLLGYDLLIDYQNAPDVPLSEKPSEKVVISLW